MRQGLQAVALLGLGGWMVGCALTTQADATDGDAARADEAVITADAAPAGDASVPTEDAAMTPDAAVDPSAPEAIMGRWRAVRYRSQGSNGQLIELGDNPARDDGSPRGAWINGILEIHPDRMLLNATQLGPYRIGYDPSNRFGPYWREFGIRTTGRWLPRNGGFIFEATSTSRAPSYSFRLDPDGMLWLDERDPANSSRTFALGFARDPIPARRTSLALSSEAVWRSEGPPPDPDLQPALFWDAPGAGFLVQRLATGPWAGSSTLRRRPFAVSLPGAPPAMYRGQLRGIPVAIAAVTFALGSHSDTARIPADQVPTPTLGLTIVWRGEGPDEALRDTPFEGTVPGYSLARTLLRRRSDPWPLWIEAFDNTHPIPLDLQLWVPREPEPRTSEDYTLREALP